MRSCSRALIALLLSVAPIGPARAQTDGSVPRFLLAEGQYPQAVAVSAGVWLLELRGDAGALRRGVVTDLELGLGGVTWMLGGGTTSSASSSYERGRSFGVQGLVHLSWPRWTPFLPPSSVFVGGKAFVGFGVLRCSLGPAWRLETGGARPYLFGGCGIGSP